MVYNQNVGKYSVPGAHSKTMSLDEFIEMFSKSNLIDDHFGQREIGPLWNLSQQTNKNETEKETHLNMTFLEFLEALARCADKFELEHM